jgi:RNA polymerase sigma-70 factor (ECF subfamily)
MGSREAGPTPREPGPPGRLSFPTTYAPTRAYPTRSAAAAEDAYAAHQREIHSFLTHCVRDRSIAEDLTQEAFLRLCREIREGRAPRNTRAWLYRVAANLAVSRGRRLGVARRWIEGVRPEEALAESPERLVVHRERTRQVGVALGALSRDAQVALLMAANGFSGHEIASALGRSDVACRTMLCRARLRLRTELGPSAED